MKRLLLLMLVATFLAIQSGCNNSNPVTPPSVKNPGSVKNTVVRSTDTSGKPLPPLQLATPPALPEKLKGKNLSKMEAAELFGLANQAMDQGDYASAAAYQYWYVKKSGTGQYNLACFLSQIKQVDPAFYWLQLAAIEEGVDAQHASQDEDLDSLRRDPRWSQMSRFLAAYNDYFEETPVKQHVLIVPAGYQVGTPIPVVIWLHGMGAEPEGFVKTGGQDIADELKIAFLGVSATRSRGPHSFVWSTDPVQDAERIQEALKACADKLTPQPGRLIALGFSQGAQAGLEVAVRAPEQYAGAIVLSPGGYPSLLGKVKPSSLLARRGFVLCCGAQEHPATVAFTSQDAKWLQQSKAQVQHKAYPGMSAHSFPEDFYERFPEWVQFILKAQKE